jgi:hypothetical protein
MGPSQPSVHSLAETVALVREPFAIEDLGSAAVPVIVTRLEANDAATDEDRADLGSILTSVRAVSVAVIDHVIDAQLALVADAFDIVVGPPDSGGTGIVDIGSVQAAVASITEAVGLHPQSAVAMAELLRLEAFDSVPQALVLESLTFSTLQAGPDFGAWLVARGPALVSADTEPPLLINRRETSLHITLNRPARANAFNAAMRDALVEALRAADTDPTIEGVVIDGAGDSFCSGGDLAEFGITPDPATAHHVRLLRSPAWWLNQLARDVRVHVHGHCVGAGIELPAFAGTVIAAPDTIVQLPEVAMGLVPGSGGTVSIPRRIGRQRTAYLAITGQPIDAQQALAWGLVDRIER